MSGSSVMSLAVVSGFVAALIAPFLTMVMRHWAGWLLALLPVLLFVYFLDFADAVAAGQTFTFSLPWLPRYGINFSFYVDGLSLLFALLISGIGALIVFYSSGYLKGHPHQGPFFGYILAFMASMLGLVLADNVVTLFVFWELTSITSFLLIGFDHEREAARRAAFQALTVTALGGIIMLAGLLMMGLAGGSFEMSELLGRGELVRNHPWAVGILLLLLAGAFTKSAQVPFHSWLPNAMEAPTPVSAYLHSATMVKAGVYLVMRVNPIFADMALWQVLLPLFGCVTLVAGTLLAVRQTDLKLMLAYTTVASLGLLVALVGIGTEYALIGAGAYLFAHSLFKGALFMVAGCVDHESGTRDITKVGGLAALMPATAGAAILAGLSMGGLPPFAGFLAKEALYAGITPETGAEYAVLAGIVFGNALMLAVGLAVAIKPFWGARPETPKHPHEAPLSMLTGPVVLAALGLILALATPVFNAEIMTPLATAIAGAPTEVHLHFWAGVNQALILSVITVALGLVFFARYEGIRSGAQAGFDAIGWGPDRGFDQLVGALTRLAYGLIGFIQSGDMRAYMRVTFITVGLALLIPPLAFGAWPRIPAVPEMTFYEAAILALAIVGVMQVVLARKRLTAVVSFGVQGFAIAVIFMLFGAPDLSFTQFMVETLSVVIIALVLVRLPLEPRDQRPATSIVFDGAMALAASCGFGLMLLSVTQGAFDATLSDFFREYSATIAHGRNIVNVILVDFRALDTLGEVAVVLMAALSALALIRLRARDGAYYLTREHRRAGRERPAQTPQS
ncbi:MAG: putative monovalent cation/H+ antiporter subunit A [Dichotomicrobium sp.]